MKTSTAIIVGVIILIVVGILFYAGTTISGNMEHNQKCSAWSQNIEQQRAELESQLFADTSSFNMEVANYNKECAF